MAQVMKTAHHVGLATTATGVKCCVFEAQSFESTLESCIGARDRIRSPCGPENESHHHVEPLQRFAYCCVFHLQSTL